MTAGDFPHRERGSLGPETNRPQSHPGRPQRPKRSPESPPIAGGRLPETCGGRTRSFTSSRTRHGRVPRENMRVLREGVIRARPVLHVVNEPGLRRGLHREKAKKPLFYNSVGRCPGPPEPTVTSRSRGTPLPAPPSGSPLEGAPR